MKPSTAFDASLGLVLSCLYLPGLLNAAVLGRWAFSALVLALLVERMPPALALAWLAYAGLSLVWAFDPWTGLGHLWWLGVFVLGASAPSRLSGMALGIAIGLLLQTPLIFVQMFGWDLIPQIPPGPAALFLNKNFLAETAALCAVLMALQGFRVLALALCAIVLATHCLEAELGLGVAAVVWITRDKPLVAPALCAVLGLAVYLAFDPTAIAVRDLGYRLIMWKVALGHASVFGHGLGSFYALYPAWGDVQTFGRPDHPHNELVLAIFELGIGAAAPAALAIMAYVRCSTARPVLALAACECAFGFPLQVPTTCVLFGLLAGASFWADGRAFRPVARRRAFLSPSLRSALAALGGD